MPDRRFTALRSPAALVLFLVTVTAGVGLDQYTKIVAFDRLSSGVNWTSFFVVTGSNPGDRSVALERSDGQRRVSAGSVIVPPTHDMPTVGQVVEIRYREALPGGNLDHPIYLGRRSDISADSCTTANEIVRAEPTHTWQLLPGWLEFEVMANQGAVFGFGQGQRILFIAVSIGAILFIFFLFASSGKQRLYQLILGMLLAGVLGNLYDRARFSFVRDMIHMRLPKWDPFPYIFNVADTLLCVGVGLMIVHSFFHDPEKADVKRENVKT